MRLSRSALSLLVRDILSVGRAKLGNDAPQEGLRVVEPLEHLEEAPVIKTRAGEMFDLIDAAHLVDELVVHRPHPAKDSVFLARGLDRADHIMAVLPLPHQAGNEARGVLEVTADAHNTVSLRMAHAIEGRVELSEVSRIQNRLSVGVAGAQHPQFVARAIGRVVVYEQDSIVVLGQCAPKLLDDRIVHGHDVHALVEAWYENRNQRPPAATLNLRRHI